MRRFSMLSLCGGAATLLLACIASAAAAQPTSAAASSAASSGWQLLAPRAGAPLNVSGAPFFDALTAATAPVPGYNGTSWAYPVLQF
jgi:hypothetical protein